MLLLHQVHRPVAQLSRMINGCHARLHREPRRGLALTVHADVNAQPRRLAHGRGQLGLGVLVRCVEIPELWIACLVAQPPELRADRVAQARRRSVGHHLVVPCSVDLHEVRPFLVLLPDRLDQLLGVVGIVGVPQDVLRRVEADRVLMPAQDRDCHAADTQPRPGISPISMACRTAASAGPAPSVPMSRSEVNPAIKSAFAASAASIVRCGTDSSTVCIPSDGAPVQEQVHVRVDQSRHERPVAQVDHFRAGGMWHRCARRPDRSPSTSTSPGLTTWPDAASKSRAACSTIGGPFAAESMRWPAPAPLWGRRQESRELSSEKHSSSSNPPDGCTE